MTPSRDADVTVEPVEHRHRWLIEGQGGPTSRGVCSCGVEQQFQNAWDGDREVRGSWMSRGRRPKRE